MKSVDIIQGIQGIKQRPGKKKEGLSFSRTIIIGADHAGVPLKKYLLPLLIKEGYTVQDKGSFDKNKPDDYPDIAVKVAKEVAKEVLKKKDIRGILICGTGTGMVMAANKVPGIRAAMCYDRYSAVMARHDNDANVLTLRSRQFSKMLAWNITKAWLTTPFSGTPRHKRRIKKLQRLDSRKK